MLLIKSKYKIAKRLGARIFEQTQTQKFALSEARSKKQKRGRRGGSDYGLQLLEKQRVRFTYGISERQLANYARKAFEKKDPAAALHRALEMRIDAASYAAGFALTRRAARQMTSHGHLTVNGKRTRIPSYRVQKGDVIAVREGSRNSPLFSKLNEEMTDSPRIVPAWLKVEGPLMRAHVVGEPAYTRGESSLDYGTVFEFYSR